MYLSACAFRALEHEELWSRDFEIFIRGQVKCWHWVLGDQDRRKALIVLWPFLRGALSDEPAKLVLWHAFGPDYFRGVPVIVKEMREYYEKLGIWDAL